eukprot:366532-Chlamydomonas_euryale.AAC.1
MGFLLAIVCLGEHVISGICVALQACYGVVAHRGRNCGGGLCSGGLLVVRVEDHVICGLGERHVCCRFRCSSTCGRRHERMKGLTEGCSRISCRCSVAQRLTPVLTPTLLTSVVQNGP